MGSRRRASKTNKSSINYWWMPLDVQPFEPDAFLTKKHAADAEAKRSGQSAIRSPDRRVTTPQLVTTLAGIWNLVGRPEASEANQSFKNHDVTYKAESICYSSDHREEKSVSSSPTIKSIYEDLSSVKKMLMFSSGSRIVGNSSIWRHVQVGNSAQIENVESVETLKNLEGLSGSMGNETDNCFNDLANDEHKYESHVSHMKNDPADLSTSSNEETDTAYPCRDSQRDTKFNIEIFQQDNNSLASVYSLQQMKTSKEAVLMLGNQISGTECKHVQQEQLTEPYSAVGESVVETSANMAHYAYENDKTLHQQNAIEECSSECQLSMERQLHSVITINRHGVAGALAGTVVSLCLHPVDTVKTIIQAGRSGHSSFLNILRRTIAERGLSGLYGGIASKIASSAPISAIYTFTYESVKGSLLPAFPKEYHSVAHCIAGGCSSIATSFVFTPSECIKQHMQVGSQYQNCWNALIGCLKKDGFASLYTGWSAVLCRNIPHSIIKFYTYEKVKQFLLISAPPDDAKLSSWQTVACGGLAGSTAALFTTPFDVVKTRMQIQAPGTLGKYEGVVHAFREITKQEGLQGLSRGLIPRLAIYISQGAIFFSSYEFLKAILSLEQKPPARAFENEEKGDDAMPLPVQKTAFLE